MVQFKYRNRGTFQSVCVLCLPASTLSVQLETGNKEKETKSIGKQKDKLNWNFDQLIFRSCFETKNRSSGECMSNPN